MHNMRNYVLVASVTWFVHIVTYHSALGANVILFPASINSHVTYFGKLGVGLVSEGDSVTMVTGSHVRIPQWLRDSGVTLLQYKVAASEPYTNSEENSRAMVKSAFAESAFEMITIMQSHAVTLMGTWNVECEEMMSDAALIRHIADGGYQMAVMDSATLECAYTLPYSLGIPFSTYSIFSFAWNYRVPALPSFTPSMFSTSTDRMTFTERLSSALMEVMVWATANHTAMRHYCQKHAPGRPVLDRWQMAQRSELWIVLYDIATGYPAPLMPNVIAIGDILTSPSKPLPPDLEQFVQSSPEGVIAVSFGSFLDHIPRDVVTKLCEAFMRVPQKVIWKLKQKSWCVAKDKVLAMDWIPQNDLLGHAKVRLFVTHAGISSVVETLYHGKPVITAPIVIDQPYNAKFMTSRNFGVSISVTDFSVDELVDKINFVLSDPTIQRSIQRGSAILKDKPETAAQRASFWINRVVKYGSDDLRSGAFELNELQFFMFDIFLFITIVIVTVLLLFLCCFIWLFKCCKRRCCKTQTQKVKQN